jgi:aldose sugar dehydrogenase
LKFNEWRVCSHFDSTTIIMKHSHLFLVILFMPTLLHAQFAIGGGHAQRLYRMHCATCHGENLEGGNGGSLISGIWKHGGTDEDLRRVITEGLPNDGMVAYKNVLSPEEIRSLVIFIREQNLLADREQLLAKTTPSGGIFTSSQHDFQLERVVEMSGIIWGLDFLPDGSLLFTERSGGVYHYQDGKYRRIEKTPAVWQRGQGGMMEVAVHPDYGNNGWIYLGYSENIGSQDQGTTTLVRGKIVNGKWTGEERIFRVPEAMHTPTHHHFGTRIAFKDGYLFFSIGDRGRMHTAQDLSLPSGKVHRIHDDGRTPDDNPFLDVEGAYPTIWSYGHRNPQGLVFDPAGSYLWSTEHGPRGGDELNLVQRGLNYGWPVITYGMNYDGSPITHKTHQEGMEQPALQWTPSIAACGIDFYTGDSFPAWKGNLFVTGLASEQLHRIVIEGDRIIEDEIVMKGQGRIRDVTTGPDGNLYVALYSGTPAQASIYRLVPKK